MANLGQLVVNLEANIASFTRDMNRASQQTEQAMSRMQSAASGVTNVLRALGGAIAVGTIVSEVNKTISALADLDDMAQKTGASVENLSKLGKVAMATGVDFGSVDGAIVKLAKNLTEIDEKGNTTAKALKAIGISAADIKNQDPAQVFVTIANKLQGYEDGAGKVALATDLMGKSAADLLPYMNDVSEIIDKFSGDSADAAAKATVLQDSLGQMRVKYEELKTEILIGALPAATDFIQAIMDTTREANKLTDGTTVDSWADEAAIGLARVADFATVTAKTMMALAGSVKVVVTDMMTLAAASPAVIAAKLASGGTPIDDLKAMLAEREQVLTAANQRWEALGNMNVNALENMVRGRIDARQALAAVNAAADGPLGLGATPTSTSREELKYVAGGGDKDKKPKKEWSREDAAKRMGALGTNEAIGLRATIDATNDLMEADQRRFEAKMQADERVVAGIQNIRASLMTDGEAENLEHETRLGELRAYRALELTDTMEADALIEQETARHKQAIDEMERRSADNRMALNMQVMQQAAGVADQMYSMLKRAGLEQTAIGRAALIASKAIAVAQIIISTNVAAAAALAPPPIGLGPVAGLGLASTIKGLGYASAAMTAGLAIAEASAEGGYDIPGGVNPVTQLHEKEMVLPKAQAEVIRGLARSGGGTGSGITINSNPQITIDSRTDEAQVHKLVYTAVAQGNADLVDKLVRAGRI
jgi:hypothetical protein